MILSYCVNLGLLIFLLVLGLFIILYYIAIIFMLTAEHLTLPWLSLAKGQGQANE